MIAAGQPRRATDAELLARKRAIDAERRAQAVLRRRHSANEGIARIARASGGFTADRAEDSA